MINIGTTLPLSEPRWRHCGRWIGSALARTVDEAPVTACPASARVVIIGGGIVGCSLLYHLAKEGWTDCLLVEKSELTSGSTWHAAGAITYGLADAGLARMAGYGVQCYPALERETGQSVSWHGCGSLRLACSDDELDQLRRMLDIGRALDHPMAIIGPDEIRAVHPFYRLDGIKAALHTPADGHLDPADAAFAFAAGARQRGACISRRNRVLGLAARRGGGWQIATEQGEIACEIVVNAGGTYARQIGQWVGLDLPVHCAAHQYLVTEPLAALAPRDRELPVLRDGFGLAAYLRQEQNAILMGFYPKQAPHLVWPDGTPWEAENALFDADLDSVMPSMALMLERMPLLAEAGIRRIVNGAIPYTPDGRMLLGPAGQPGFWCACGVSVGVGLGAGIGRYLAQLMVHGAAEISLRPFDPAASAAGARAPMPLPRSARTTGCATRSPFLVGIVPPAARSGPARSIGCCRRRMPSSSSSPAGSGRSGSLATPRPTTRSAFAAPPPRRGSPGRPAPSASASAFSTCPASPSSTSSARMRRGCSIAWSAAGCRRRAAPRLPIS
jgi:glycine/D-amino acid oxidase-like deaminating enzyme